MLGRLTVGKSFQTSTFQLLGRQHVSIDFNPQHMFVGKTIFESMISILNIYCWEDNLRINDFNPRQLMLGRQVSNDFNPQHWLLGRQFNIELGKLNPQHSVEKTSLRKSNPQQSVGKTKFVDRLRFSWKLKSSLYRFNPQQSVEKTTIQSSTFSWEDNSQSIK